MTGSARRIALIAHDNLKDDICDWAGTHRGVLARHALWATGTTGGRIAEATGLEVTVLRSGPKGGDLQIGAMIAEGRLDVLVFLWDPLSAMPHDVDVKALLRIATLRQVVTACNRATADLVARSALVAA